MKKIILLLFFNITYSQLNKGKVTYMLYNSFSEEKLNKGGLFGSYYQKAIEENGKISYILLFDEKNSIFKREFDDLQKFDLFSYYTTNIIYDRNTSCFTYNQSKSEILIKDKYKIIKCDTIKWVIENESKLIDEKICYKATKYDYTYNKGEKKLKSIIAWFCPEIPLRLGPLTYNDLPGLIFELTINNETTYILSKIENLNDINIKEIEGIEIDFDNYEKLSDDIFQEALFLVKKQKQ